MSVGTDARNKGLGRIQTNISVFSFQKALNFALIGRARAGKCADSYRVSEGKIQMTIQRQRQRQRQRQYVNGGHELYLHAIWPNEILLGVPWIWVFHRPTANVFSEQIFHNF
jgi:hypothetical protein